MNHLVKCPIEQLPSFVEDALGNEQSDLVIQHLDECEACRRRVEVLAGPEEDWAVVAEAFTDGEADLSRIALSDGTSTAERGSDSRRIDPALILQLLAPSDDPRAAGRIGPFEITGIVGTGGMGVVVKAREPALDRYVAIKMLSPHLASSPSARKRFAREARAAAAVIHENVIAIYQVALWNDLPYLVMPYLPDPSLQQRIEDEGPLDLEQTLSVGMQIARGLSAAHTQGLVHRDVKPANVLLSKGTERAVITDFGLARASDDASLTRAGSLAGTPHYMSPEQARGDAVDAGSDLFSLGSVLFTMIAGHPPVQHELGSETIQQIASGKIPSLQSVAPSTPEWFLRIVDWLHQSDPARRPESAEELAELLEQCLAHHRQPSKTALPERLVRAKSNKSRTAIFVAGAAIVTGLVFAGMTSMPQPDGVGILQNEMPRQEHSPADIDDPEPGTVPDTTDVSQQNATDPQLNWQFMDQQFEALTREMDFVEQELNQ